MKLMNDITGEYQALTKGPFKYLNDRFPYPFIYLNLWNPYPYIYSKPEKGIPFGRSLSLYIDHYREYPPGSRRTCIHSIKSWPNDIIFLLFQSTEISSPNVLLTAQHTVVGLKHDAATVWVENINSNTFLACSREMQNFDGLHEDIRLVSY